MNKCENCGNGSSGQAVYDLLAVLAERTIKRLWVIIILLVVLLFGTNAAWIYYESQFSMEEVTSTEIEQDTDGGGNNYVIGGDFNGEAKDQSDKAENANP